MLIVYFSSSSGNTERFVNKLGLPNKRIPSKGSETLEVDEPYILIIPTYAGDDGKGAVHKKVVEFLKNPDNRKYLLAVIGTGNRNFGKYYGYAGDVVSKNCNVPCIYKLELSGTYSDVEEVLNRVNTYESIRH